MIPKTLFEEDAEKFALFQTSDGSFFLRGLLQPYHNDIKARFLKEAEQERLRIEDWNGAKFYVQGNTVELYDCSAAWGNFPEGLKETLFALFKEAFPNKTIVDNLD
jgi:hypothetical protein